MLRFLRAVGRRRWEPDTKRTPKERKKSDGGHPCGPPANARPVLTREERVAAVLAEESPLKGLMAFSDSSVRDRDLGVTSLGLAFERMFQLIHSAKIGSDFSTIKELTHRLQLRTSTRVYFGLRYLADADLRKRTVSLVEEAGAEFAVRLEQSFRSNKAIPTAGAPPRSTASSGTLLCRAEISNLTSSPSLGTATESQLSVSLPPRHWAALAALTVLGGLMAEANVDVATRLATRPAFSRALAKLVVEGLAFHAAMYFLLEPQPEPLATTGSYAGPESQSPPPSFSLSSSPLRRSRHRPGHRRPRHTTATTATPSSMVRNMSPDSDQSFPTTTLSSSLLDQGEDVGRKAKRDDESGASRRGESVAGSRQGGESAASRCPKWRMPPGYEGSTPPPHGGVEPQCHHSPVKRGFWYRGPKQQRANGAEQAGLSASTGIPSQWKTGRVGVPAGGRAGRPAGGSVDVSAALVDSFVERRARLESFHLLPCSLDRFIFGSVFLDMANTYAIERKLTLVFEYLASASECRPHLALRAGLTLLEALAVCDALYEAMSDSVAALGATLRLLDRLVRTLTRAASSEQRSPPARPRGLLRQLLSRQRRQPPPAEVAVERDPFECLRSALDELHQVAVALLTKMAGGCKTHHHHMFGWNGPSDSTGAASRAVASVPGGSNTCGLASSCDSPPIVALRGAQAAVLRIVAFVAERAEGMWEAALKASTAEEILLILERIAIQRPRGTSGVARIDSAVVAGGGVESAVVGRVSSRFEEFSRCAACGQSLRKKQQTFFCPACRCVRYCSAECQDRDAILHVAVCSQEEDDDPWSETF